MLLRMTFDRGIAGTDSLLALLCKYFVGLSISSYDLISVYTAASCDLHPFMSVATLVL
jgi:hypothetical protein